MALNCTEFTKVKKEHEPIAPCSTGEITQSEQQTKCGEIFTKNHLDFILICVFCEKTYESMVNFGKHYQEKHLSTSLSESMKVKRDNNDADFTELLPLDSPQYDDYFDSDNVKYEIDTNSITPQPDVVLIKADSSECVKEECCAIDPIDFEVNGDEDESRLRFTCSVCTRSYSRKFDLTRHKCKPIKEPAKKKKRSGEDPQKNSSKPSNNTKSPTSRKTEPSEKSTDEKNTIKTSLAAEDTNLFCEICNKQFTFRGIFRRHGLRHETIPLALQRDPDYLKCWFCGVEFTELKDWRQHEEQHGEPPTFICLQCPKIFKRDYDLQMHMNIHTGQKPFKCTQCPLAFAHSLNLDQHIKRIHLKIARHLCEVCNKKFPTRTECEFHKRIHTGEKPFQCEVCGNNFRLHGQLREHRKMHEKSRDYKCNLCPAAFYSKPLLKGHMVIHSDERPFVCNVCGRTFNRRVALATHKKLHLDVKQYVCVCGKGFAQLAGLYSHRKSHEKTSLN